MSSAVPKDRSGPALIAMTSSDWHSKVYSVPQGSRRLMAASSSRASCILDGVGQSDSSGWLTKCVCTAVRS
jgi:hypothetical protein